jgi:hypothetical protein
MAQARVTLYLNGQAIAESGATTTDPDGDIIEVTDQLLDKWADQFRTSRLTLAALNVDSWDVIEFDVNGTIYTRNY